jgi:hypothetical protein
MGFSKKEGLNSWTLGTLGWTFFKKAELFTEKFADELKYSILQFEFHRINGIGID